MGVSFQSWFSGGLICCVFINYCLAASSAFNDFFGGLLPGLFAGLRGEFLFALAGLRGELDDSFLFPFLPSPNLP